MDWVSIRSEGPEQAPDKIHVNLLALKNVVLLVAFIKPMEAEEIFPSSFVRENTCTVVGAINSNRPVAFSGKK